MAKPILNMKIGKIEMALWENEGKNNKTGKTFYSDSVTAEKNYKDGDSWKKTTSFSIDDVPLLVAGYNELYKYSKIQNPTYKRHGNKENEDTN